MFGFCFVPYRIKLNRRTTVFLGQTRFSERFFAICHLHERNFTSETASEADGEREITSRKYKLEIHCLARLTQFHYKRTQPRRFRTRFAHTVRTTTVSACQRVASIEHTDGIATSGKQPTQPTVYRRTNATEKKNRKCATFAQNTARTSFDVVCKFSLHFINKPPSSASADVRCMFVFSTSFLP